MPRLTWLGNDEAKGPARRVPYRLLDPVEQVGDPAALDTLIQGDNLDALKALMPFYEGRVKCIFIDPPHNTKSAFEHSDDNLEPDFVLQLDDGRIVVVEYKGADRWSNDDSKEKRDIGAVWASVSGGRCRFTPQAAEGRSIEAQIRGVIA